MSDNGKKIDVEFGARTAELDAALKDLVGSVSGASLRIREELDKIGDQSKKTKDKTEDSARGIGAAFQRIHGQVVGGAGSVVGAFRNIYNSVFSVHTAIVGLATGALVTTITTALETAAAINDVSQAANISTTALQELRFAADQNGASAEILDDAVIKLNKSLGDFRTTGAGPAADALRQLGLDQRVMRGEFATTDDVLDEVLNRLAEVPGNADRAALASDLFGRSAGPRMAEMLKIGADGIRAARDEAHKLGLVLDEDMIGKADAASDELNKLWASLETAGVKAISENADAIRELAAAFAEEMPDIIEWIRQYMEWWGIASRSPERMANATVAKLEQLLAQANEPSYTLMTGGLVPTVGGAGVRAGAYSKAEIERMLADARRELAGFDADFNAKTAGGQFGLSGVDRPADDPFALPVAREVEGIIDVKFRVDSEIVDDPFKLPEKTIDIAPRLGAGYDAASRRQAAADAESEAAQAAKSADDLARQSAQTAISTEEQKQLAMLEIWRRSTDQRHALNQRDDFMQAARDQVYLAQQMAIAERETQIKRQAIEAQLAVENLEPQQRLQLNALLEQLEVDHQARMAQIKDQAEQFEAERRARVEEAELAHIDRIAQKRDELTNTTEGFVNRLMSSQMNAQSLLMVFAQEAQSMFARLIAEKVAMAIYGEAAQTGAAAQGAAARGTIGAKEQSLSLGAQIKKTLKSIAIAAQEAFANVYAWASPFMGPLAVIPATAAAAVVGAAALIIPSAAGGTEVERDGLFKLHEKEVVLPRFWSDGLRNVIGTMNANPGRPTYPSLPQIAAANPDGKGIAQTGAASYSLSVSAMDAQGVRDFFRSHGREIGSAMHRIAEDGHFSRG